jgi:hypothetical protein
MENRNNYTNRILILADFSEGNQSAIDFAIKYLYNDTTKVFLVQTWQKPSYGASMVRDLAPILQDISKRELKALKADLLTKYDLQEQEVEMLSFEGELSRFFQSEWYQNHNWQVVLGLNETNSELQYNPRFKEIVQNVNQPLYVLNNCKANQSIDNIYVWNSNSSLSLPILSSLQKVCAKQKCNVHVGLNINHITISEKAEIVKTYANACIGSNVRFEKLSESVQKPLNVDSLLTIYHSDKSPDKERDLLSYFDKWFVKSKGITVRNF